MKKLCFFLIFLIALSLIPSVFADDWISPTGFIDPDGKWFDEPKAYDEDVNAYAYSNWIDGFSWSSFLELTIDAITCDKVRFNALYGLYTINSIDLDVFRDGSWVDVYQGAFLDHVWVEKSFVEGSVTEARVRFYNSFFMQGMARVYEFDFWEIEEEPPPEEYFFTFSESMNISASSYVWKAKMFSGTETVTISSASYVWKEKLFFFSENPSITDSLSILKEKLMAFVEFAETINPTSEVIFIFPSPKIPILFVGLMVIMGLIAFVFFLSRRKKK